MTQLINTLEYPQLGIDYYVSLSLTLFVSVYLCHVYLSLTLSPY